MPRLLDDVKSAMRSEVENSDVVSFDDLEFEHVVWDLHGEEVPVIIICVTGYDFWAHIMRTSTTQYTLEALAREKVTFIESMMGHDSEETGLFNY